MIYDGAVAKVSINPLPPGGGGLGVGEDAMNASGGENVEDNRKKWIQPQLIVLGRGTPEESVLAGCKLTAKTGKIISGLGTTKNNCYKRNAMTNCSKKCSNLSTAS